jgi:hypothetical protein
MARSREWAMAEQRVYKVIFNNQGQIYEIYAKGVSQGSLFGFVEVEQILFGERSQVVVDPSEDKLKSEFKGVKRVHIPLHAVVRIDEVERQGVGRISPAAKGDGTVASFPTAVYGKPDKDPGKS